MWPADKPGQDSECGSVKGSEACGSGGREKESEKRGLARSVPTAPSYYRGTAHIHLPERQAGVPGPMKAQIRPQSFCLAGMYLRGLSWRLRNSSPAAFHMLSSLPATPIRV